MVQMSCPAQSSRRGCRCFVGIASLPLESRLIALAPRNIPLAFCVLILLFVFYEIWSAKRWLYDPLFATFTHFWQFRYHSSHCQAKTRLTGWVTKWGKFPYFRASRWSGWLERRKKGEKWEKPLPLEAKLRGSGYLILKRSEIGSEKNLLRPVITHI